MITIPLKTTQTAQWADQIRPALSSIYGRASGFDKEIDEIESLREAVVHVTPNATGRDTLYSYYAQLEMMSAHIPMEPFRVEFEWKNAYDNRKEIHKSIVFEKSCVLFNLAAVMSSLAEEAYSSKDYKQAYHLLSCSAGIFKFISENYLRSYCDDLSIDALTALCKLMLAQAQECFFMKAKESNAAPGLLAKLAQGTSSLYQNSSELLNKLYNEHWWCNITVIEETTNSAENMQIEAHLSQLDHLEKQHQTGDALAHLREAKKKMTDKNAIEDAKSRMKLLEKENDMIYHEPVPAVVPELIGTVVAKPLPLESIYSSKEEANKVIGRDIFERIIPLEVHEKASLYSEMKAQFLRDQIEKTEIADLELKSGLEYVGHSEVISKFRKSPLDLAEVPSDIIEYSMTVESVRTDSLNDDAFKWGIKTDFSQERSRTIKLINAQQGSSDANILDSIQNAKQGLLETGMKMKQLAANVDTLNVNQEMDVLCQPRQLEAHYRKNAIQACSAIRGSNIAASVSLLDLDDASDTGKESTFEEKMNNVSDLLAKLQKIMRERKNSLNELRDQVRNDDITNKISLQSKKLENIENTLFAVELDKFSGITRRIDATIRLQNAVLNDLNIKFSNLVDSSDARKLLGERDTIIKTTELLSERLRSTFKRWSSAFEQSKQLQERYAQIEREVLSAENPIRLLRPAVPPKPPKENPTSSGLSGYSTPSTYDPAMYK